MFCFRENFDHCFTFNWFHYCFTPLKKLTKKWFDSHFRCLCVFTTWIESPEYTALYGVTGRLWNHVFDDAKKKILGFRPSHMCPWRTTGSHFENCAYYSTCTFSKDKSVIAIEKLSWWHTLTVYLIQRCQHWTLKKSSISQKLRASVAWAP